VKFKCKFYSSLKCLLDSHHGGTVLLRNLNEEVVIDFELEQMSSAQFLYCE